jgi:hypothetical protein
MRKTRSKIKIGSDTLSLIAALGVGAAVFAPMSLSATDKAGVVAGLGSLCQDQYTVTPCQGSDGCGIYTYDNCLMGSTGLPNKFCQADVIQQCPSGCSSLMPSTHCLACW